MVFLQVVEVERRAYQLIHLSWFPYWSENARYYCATILYFFHWMKISRSFSFPSSWSSDTANRNDVVGSMSWWRKGHTTVHRGENGLVRVPGGSKDPTAKQLLSFILCGIRTASNGCQQFISIDALEHNGEGRCRAQFAYSLLLIHFHYDLL